MIPLPINPTLRWKGRGRWVAIGHCEDNHGGNAWVVPAVPAVGSCGERAWRPDWNHGQRAARISDLTPTVPKRVSS